MACGCRKKSAFSYVWTSADGEKTVTYNSEIEAKARKLRQGGDYVTVPKG